MTGGPRKCIPNDHLVEIYVHKVKEAMRAMGANVTFNAVRRAAKCISWLEGMSSKLAAHLGGKHAQDKTEADVEEMAISLVKLWNLEYIPGRSHKTFQNFPADLLQNIDLHQWNCWLTQQKIRAAVEMQ